MNIRITSKIIYDVAIFMVGFGIFIGIIFPFFIIFMGIPSQWVLNSRFFLYCVFAGIIVAIINIVIVKMTIIKRINVLAKQMKEVGNTLKVTCTTEGYNCEPDDYLLSEDSDDTLGESIKAFNSLIISLSQALKYKSDVYSFTSMLSKHLDANNMLECSLSMLVDYTDAVGGVILYNNGCSAIIATSGINYAQNILENKIISEVLKKGKPCIFRSKDGFESCNELIFKEKWEYAFVQPIIYEVKPIGVILLTKNSFFTDEEINKLDTLSMSLSIALANASAHNQFQELALKDPLTGLYNRRYGLLHLNDAYKYSIQENYPLGIIMIDIDNFKNVNDTYGHQVGDEALVHISKLLKSSIREGDFIIRYGGEEFLCILPGANLKESYEVAERARKRIMSSTLNSNNLVLNITISGGVCSYPDAGCKSADNLINVADRALYEAKNSGRNKIIAS